MSMDAYLQEIEQQAKDALRDVLPLARQVAEKMWEHIPEDDPFLCGAFVLYFASTCNEEVHQCLPERCLVLYGDRLSELMQLFHELM